MKTLTAVDTFLHSRVSGNLSPRTIDWYHYRLQRFADRYPELPQEPGAIEGFLSAIQGAENKHGYYRTLKAFYRFLSKRHQLANPIDLVNPPRRPRKVMATLEPHQLMRLIQSASTARDRAMLLLLIDTGVRSSELADLRKQDIEIETVIVRGKTGEREVPISEEVRRALLCLLNLDGSSEYVFHGERGPLSRKGVYHIISTHMKKAGIDGPKLGGHRIRHAFGKGYLVNGGDIRSLQVIMGHANITTTQKYTALNLSDTIEKHHRFSPLRSTHAAAQGTLFSDDLVREAEEIVTRGQDKTTG